MVKLNKINLLLTKYGQWLLILAIVFYILIFGFITLWKYYNFFYDALDLAIINQVFYNSSQGNFFASSVHPPTYLGDHLSPIIFLLLPLYLIWRQPQTLLLLQTIILALAAWPIYLIAKNALNKSLAILFGLAWLINPFVQNINLFEFSFLPWAVFFILLAFYFYQTNRFYPFLISGLLALGVREDVALVVFMFGIVAAIERKKIKWILTPIIAGLIYFLAVLAITNYFAPANYKFFIYYSWLGSSPIAALQNLIFEPWRLIFHLFKLGNLEFIIAIFLPLVFLPLTSPLYLLLGLGVFGQLILGSSGASITLLQTHYASLLLPAVFLAAIYSWKKIISGGQANKPRIFPQGARHHRKDLAYISSALKQAFGYWGRVRDKLVAFINQYRELAGLVLVVGLVYSSLTLGPAIGSLAKIGQSGLLTADSQAKKELLVKIPAQAAVAASYEFLAPLSSRPNLYSFNYIFLGKQQFLSQDYSLPPDTEYLIIDYQDLITYQLQYGNNQFYQKQYQTARQSWPEILADFGLIEINDSFALYRKGAQNQFELIKILENQPKIENQQRTGLSNGIEFLGFNQKENQHQLFWQINQPTAKKYRLKITLADDQKTVLEKIYPFAYDLLVSEKELAKKIIQTNYWFNLKQKLPAGSYELRLSLIEIEKGGIEIDAIRSTKDVIDQEILIGEINLGQITI